MSNSPNVLVATFTGLDWCAPHDVQTWWGQRWPSDVRVAAASCLLFDGDGRLVVANIRSRGWDVPGGRLGNGEGVLDGLGRELAEEVGAHAGEYTDPELLVNTGRGLVREAAAKSRESFSIDATVMRWLIDASASGKEARHTMGNGTDLGQQRQKPSF